MKNKPREDWTFNELVEYCSLTVLEQLMCGSFKAGIYTAVDVSVMWHEDQLKKNKK
jgi:hypothetical protein